MIVNFFKTTRRGYSINLGSNTACLQADNWDDFGYKTLFILTVFDEQGCEQLIGNVKIGFVGQGEGWTTAIIPDNFTQLSSNYFSLGQDVEYYKNIKNKLSKKMAESVLVALGDVVFKDKILPIAEHEQVFSLSLTRTVNHSTIEQQFRRVLRGEAPLTDYDFFYEKAAYERFSGIRVDFKVEPNSKPSSNIHILIGRNGVGKTTLLNKMVDALLPNRGAIEETGFFATQSWWEEVTPLHENYFAGVVSISFSAFDPFTPPDDQFDENSGMRYCYVGLKKRGTENSQDKWALKDKDDLCLDFTKSLKLCFSLSEKKNRWVNAVTKLESDLNFAEMELCQLADIYVLDESESKKKFSEKASQLFGVMSSGHAVVILTITKLVEKVEEKTLVLLDEPESHLHPPLLSAFTRALSDLLNNRNGVAIIATHSPVILQEVPASCVTIIRRTGQVTTVEKPEIQTFAENVGVLTREIFGLEVSKSGFHDLLKQSVSESKSYEEIETEYRDQLGFEGKAILRAMIANRKRQRGNI